MHACTIQAFKELTIKILLPKLQARCQHIMLWHYNYLLFQHWAMRLMELSIMLVSTATMARLVMYRMFTNQWTSTRKKWTIILISQRELEKFPLTSLWVLDFQMFRSKLNSPLIPNQLRAQWMNTSPPTMVRLLRKMRMASSTLLQRDCNRQLQITEYLRSQWETRVAIRTWDRLSHRKQGKWKMSWPTNPFFNQKKYRSIVTN